MRVRVDRLGRVVIPKPVRDALGLGPGVELVLVTDGAGLRLDPVADAARPIEYADGLPLLGSVAGAALSDADVRRMTEEGRR